MTNFYIPPVNREFFTNRVLEDATTRGKSCMVQIRADGRVITISDTGPMEEAG